MNRVRGKGASIVLSRASENMLKAMRKNPRIILEKAGYENKIDELVVLLESRLNEALMGHPTFHGHFAAFVHKEASRTQEAAVIDIVPIDIVGRTLMTGTQERDITAKTGKVLRFVLKPKASPVKFDFSGQGRDKGGKLTSGFESHKREELKDGDVLYMKQVHIRGITSRAAELTIFVNAVIKEVAKRVMN